MTFYIPSYPHRMMRRWMHMAACPAGNEWPLALNVREEDEAFVIQALTPSLRPEDIQIQMADDIITIEGHFPETEGEYLLRELPVGDFRRTLHLPAPVDAEKAEARLEAGVLTLRLPKSEVARTKTIRVTAR
jgi:HSP20 family protein